MDGHTGERLRQFELRRICWKVPVYYAEESFVGGGSFGNVIEATDMRPERRGERVAIKKLSRPFNDVHNAKRVFRELRLLRLLQHDNLIELLNVYTPDDEARVMAEVYLVTRHAGEAISHDICKQLNIEHQRIIIYQILCGLKYLHSADIVHRDLKPANLAINPDCDLTILDFGLARRVSTEIMTEYVVTRYYRPPEVVYWSGIYDQKADMWSVGCILAELILGRVLFAGTDQFDQFRRIIELCGSPDAEHLEKIGRRSSADTRAFLERHYGGVARRPFASAFEGADADAVDLLDRLLVLDPDKRLSVKEALGHAFLAQYHSPADERERSASIQLDDETTERLDLAGWRRTFAASVASAQLAAFSASFGMRSPSSKRGLSDLPAPIKDC